MFPDQDVPSTITPAAASAASNAAAAPDTAISKAFYSTLSWQLLALLCEIHLDLAGWRKLIAVLVEERAMNWKTRDSTKRSERDPVLIGLRCAFQQLEHLESDISVEYISQSLAKWNLFEVSKKWKTAVNTIIISQLPNCSHPAAECFSAGCEEPRRGEVSFHTLNDMWRESCRQVLLAEHPD